MPLAQFSPAHRARIDALANAATPPPRFITTCDGLAQIPSRAWVEWHLRHPRRGSRRREIPPHLRDLAIARDGLICQLCGDPVDRKDLHIDHRVPVARGGRTEIDNLQVAHSLCNLRKGTA